MKLIDRYIYAVTENLKENIREDISRELRTNIEDMLPDDPTEDDIRKVLEKLGDPKKLASDYNEEKRYLIGPELYDSYIFVIKLVTSIFAAVAVCGVFLSEIISLPTSEGLIETVIEIIVRVISSGFEGAIQGALWVTIVFAILERTGEKSIGHKLNKKWSVKDLPELPVGEKGKISRGETIFAMIFTVIFTAIIYFSPNLIGIYTKSENGFILIEPLFVNSRLKFYIPIFLLIVLFQFLVYVWRFIVGKWTISLALVNTLCNVATCILMYAMIGDKTLFNEGFIKKIMYYIDISASNIEFEWSKGIRNFLVVFALIALWDSISGFLKCRKVNKIYSKKPM